MHAAPLQPPENRPAPAAPSGYCQSPRREKQSSGGSQSGNEKIQHQRAPWLRTGWPELVTAHHPDWEVWAFYVLGTQVQLVSGVAHGTWTPRSGGNADPASAGVGWSETLHLGAKGRAVRWVPWKTYNQPTNKTQKQCAGLSNPSPGDADRWSTEERSPANQPSVNEGTYTCRALSCGRGLRGKRVGGLPAAPGCLPMGRQVHNELISAGGSPRSS